MIIADIKGKLPELQNWEDYLTSCVFSSLKYLGDDYSERFLRTARSLDSRYFDVSIRNAIYDFWPREGNTEPDVVISTKEAVIIIEAKFYSGKSGIGVETEKEADIQKEQKELKKQLRDQLAREYLFGKNKKKQFYVILVTAGPIFPTEDIEETLKAIENMQGKKEVQNARKHMFWTKWHHIGPIMEEIIKEDNHKTYQSLIAKELLEFLNRRGLNIFKGFGFLSDYLTVFKNGPMQKIFYKNYSPKYWLWLEDVKSKQSKIDKDIFYSKGGDQK